MCILFLHTNDNPAPNQFRLILASNRDEHYARPTRQAHFWEEESQVIGGRDMEPGREGGSWLALSTQGRIAVLLNVAGEDIADPSSNLGRGFLVADLVTNKDNQSQDQYLQRLSETGHKYNPFNLITIELQPQNIEIRQYSNGRGANRNAEKVETGTRGWGNSIPSHPFRKVVAGISRLEAIVEEHGYLHDRDVLVQQLLSLLKWEQRHLPDPELKQRLSNRPASEAENVSSVFVKKTESGYMTRTHTIILIDARGHVSYMEWTMKEPISPDNPQWLHIQHSFKLT